jgi:hypothetical protein
MDNSEIIKTEMFVGTLENYQKLEKILADRTGNN